MDLMTFILMITLVLAAGGIIYLYAKKVVGRGDIRGVMEDPHSRKQVLIMGAAVAGIFLVIVIGLSVTGVMKW